MRNLFLVGNVKQNIGLKFYILSNTDFKRQTCFNLIILYLMMMMTIIIKKVALPGGQIKLDMGFLNTCPAILNAVRLFTFDQSSSCSSVLT